MPKKKITVKRRLIKFIESGNRLTYQHGLNAQGATALRKAIQEDSVDQLSSGMGPRVELVYGCGSGRYYLIRVDAG